MFWIVSIESGLFILTELAKKKCKSTIVRFTTFRHRTLFYRVRKNLKKAKVKLDLTKSRFDLLKRANNHVKKVRAINFCCADVNCRLVSRRFKSCFMSLIVKSKYTLFYLFIILILQSYVISQLTFTNQEPLLWSIIKFDNENISMMPSLVVFLINLSILFSLYFCIFLYS